MMLTPQKLRHDANALSRSLLTPRPYYADGALALVSALERYQAANGLLPDGQWVRVTNRENVGHIEIKSAVSGQYRRALPAGVDPNSVIAITVDPFLGAASALLAQLTSLADSLSAGRRPKICSTGEMIEFQRMPEVFWNELKDQLARVKEAIAPGYNDTVVAGRSHRLLSLLLPAVQNKDLGPVQREVEELACAVSQLRATHAADATLTAWAMIFSDLCQAIAEHCKAAAMNSIQSAATLIRYVAFVATPGGVTDPVGLTLGLVNKTAREGLHELSATLADRYFQDGLQLVNQALEQQTLDAFGALLYEAGPLFYAATRIFKGLIEGPGHTVPESTASVYAVRANVAEEQAVRVTASLLNMVENRAGFKWQLHQDRLRDAQSSGPTAVRQEVLRIIEQNYFYPRCWQKELCGPASDLPPLQCADPA
jgi:hypothetical protein